MGGLLEGATIVHDYLTYSKAADEEVPHHPSAVGMINFHNTLQR